MNNLQLKILERLCDHIECGEQFTHISDLCNVPLPYPSDIGWTFLTCIYRDDKRYAYEYTFSGPNTLSNLLNKWNN